MALQHTCEKHCCIDRDANAVHALLSSPTPLRRSPGACNICQHLPICYCHACRPVRVRVHSTAHYRELVGDVVQLNHLLLHLFVQAGEGFIWRPITCLDWLWQDHQAARGPPCLTSIRQILHKYRNVALCSSPESCVSPQCQHSAHSGDVHVLL